jgi:hypothetical protein
VCRSRQLEPSPGRRFRRVRLRHPEDGSCVADSAPAMLQRPVPTCGRPVPASWFRRCATRNWQVDSVAWVSALIGLNDAPRFADCGCCGGARPAAEHVRQHFHAR